MNWRTMLAVAALATGQGVPELHAATILVPGDYASVLAAVDAAVAGDSVLVGPGTWSDIDTRTVVINGLPRLLTGCAFPQGGVSIIGSGIDVTVLDPSPGDTGAGSLITIAVLEAVGQGGVIIEALTLARARRPAGGTALGVANADEVIVRSCRFTENGTEDLSVVSSGAVLAGGGASIQFIDCLVDHNICTGGGALSASNADLTIVGCRFEENLGRMIQTNNTHSPGSQVRIEDSEFVRNRAENGPVCVIIQSSTGFLITGCRFVENVAETGVAASILTSDSGGDIEFCVFERDSCLAVNGAGAGIWWEASQGSVTNCTFVECYSGLGGVAFSVTSGGSVEFRQNLVTHSSGGPSVRVGSTSALLPGTGCNIFWANQAGDYQNWSVVTGDVIADPFYCDFGMGDYMVRGDSPCLVGPCTLVGAYGLGCAPVSIESMSWAGIKALYRLEGGRNADHE